MCCSIFYQGARVFEIIFVIIPVCVVNQFSVLLLLIFALELGAGISGYIMRGEVDRMLQNRMNNTMPLYQTDPDVQRSWDVMQHDVSTFRT